MAKKYRIWGYKTFRFPFYVKAETEEEALIIAYSKMADEIEDEVSYEPDDDDFAIKVYIEDEYDFDEEEPRNPYGDPIYSIDDLNRDGEIDDYEWAKEHLRQWQEAEEKLG